MSAYAHSVSDLRTAARLSFVRSERRALAKARPESPRTKLRWQRLDVLISDLAYDLKRLTTFLRLLDGAPPIAHAGYDLVCNHVANHGRPMTAHEFAHVHRFACAQLYRIGFTQREFHPHRGPFAHDELLRLNLVFVLPDARKRPLIWPNVVSIDTAILHGTASAAPPRPDHHSTRNG